MGQTASKAGKTVEALAKRTVETARQAQRPAILPPLPPTGISGEGSSDNDRTTQANNPAMFLRGTGIAQQDIRDRGQELYLQTRHKLNNEQRAHGPVDMPKDLLQFLQDVGPTSKAVDRERTAPRLLEEGNAVELIKVESVRRVTRERFEMPLVEGDNTFTTPRNTNFSRRSTAQEEKDFGLTNLQLYRLLMNREQIQKEGVDAFYESVMPKQEATLWSDEEKAAHKKLLMDALKCIEVPILRTDSEGTFFGLYAKDVPGENVKAIRPIPESKVKLVLKHLLEAEEQSGDVAAAKLERRRELRKTRVLS